MDPSSSELDDTRAHLRRYVSRSGGPCTPFTTAEIAERLGDAERNVARNLSRLVELGELRTRKLADGSRVWWQPANEVDFPDQRSKLQEFGAFVSAVRDYAIFMLDPDGTVVSWNQGAKRIKGYSEAEIVGEPFSTFYTEDAIEEGVPESNLETAAEEGRVEDEGWRIRKDGSWFWADVVITAIRDVDGTLQGFTKVTRDMTEQREYEQRLRRERDLTEQILETVPVGISVIDSDGTFVRANRQALALLEMNEADLGELPAESKALYDAEGDLVPGGRRPWTRVSETGEPVYDFQCRIDRSEGDRRWLSMTAVPLDGIPSGDGGTVVVIEDVTDRRERERRLERRRSELRTELGEILGRISDAFFALDEDRRFTHFNERAAELFQRSEDELLGQSLRETFPERAGGRLGEEFDGALDTQEHTNFEQYDDELDAWLEYNVYPSESGLSVYIHDITDRREYQRKLEESNERLEQFAHAASHDLQEPLRMVSSYLQLIERRYADALDEDGREFIEFAVDGADRMRNMIDGLLAYSRVETRGEPFEPVDLGDVLVDVRDDLQMKIVESDAEITAEPLPRVRGDRGQLRQVLQNLLDNAIVYSGDEPPRVRFEAERDGDEWVVSVSDEGIGIDPENADRVFDVFQRLHSRDRYEGTGIGLALCERIVERHGGELWVDSVPGEGTTFSFTLPATTPDDA